MDAPCETAYVERYVPRIVSLRGCADLFVKKSTNREHEVEEGGIVQGEGGMKDVGWSSGGTRVYLTTRSSLCLKFLLASTIT